MNYFNQIQLMMILCLPVLVFSQVEAIFNDINMGASLELVTEKLTEISDETELISIAEPSFPLAMHKEAHLICTSVKTKEGILDRVVFTFADDALAYILAKGNTEKVFVEHRKDTALVYMDYDVYFKDKLFLNKKKNLAWLISEEAVHPHMFTWENPYLDRQQNSPKENYSTVVPSYLKMGARLDEMKPIIEKYSEFSVVELLDGSDPNAQVQINGFVMDCLGFSRKIEARFGNETLNVIWILTGKGEEDRIRKALIAQYGAAIFKSDTWEIFNNWQVGLRKDKPEVLLLTKELALEYKKTYFKQ